MTDPLIVILESLQAQAYIDSPDPRPADANARRNYETAVRETLGPDALDDICLRTLTDAMPTVGDDGVPTRFEDPVAYSYLATAALKIERALDRLGLPLASRPLLGTLPLGCLEPVTADTQPAAAGHLVLIESQFVTFGMLLSAAVSAGPPRRSRLFSDLLLAYATSGRPGAINPLPIELNRGTLSSLVSIMLLFVLGHEYAHVVLGHLPQADRQSGLLPHDTPALVYSWSHELDADMIGIRLAADAAAQDGVAFATVLRGADLLFSAMDIMDRAVALLRSGDELAARLGSHPPGTLRRDSLRRMVRQVKASGARGVIGTAIKAAEQQQQDLDDLWIAARPVLTREHLAGTRVHPRWHSRPLEDTVTHGE